MRDKLCDYDPCEVYQAPFDGSDMCRECGCEEADHVG